MTWFRGAATNYVKAKSMIYVTHKLRLQMRFLTSFPGGQYFL